MKLRPAYSLMEVLVVISILSILGGAVTSFIVSSLREHRSSEAQVALHASLNLAIDKFTRVARSSTLLIEANQTTFRVRGYPKAADTVASEIKFYLEDQVLKYSVIPPSGTPPNYSYNPADAIVYQLLRKVSNDTHHPLFYYLDENNNRLRFPVNLADIRAVEFVPSALDENNVLRSPVTVSTTVSLRNFKTNL